MGVLNATPDSFYAGARFSNLESALGHAEHLAKEGADVIDVGGESTRPGASPVTVAVELSRVLPLIQVLREKSFKLPISIDTQKAQVAHDALRAGANLVNDVSALQADPEMAAVVADAHCPVVLMHMQGTPQIMQKAPVYNDVVHDILEFFEERLRFAKRHGIREDRIILDPGIGFGKTLDHNLTLLQRLHELTALGRPILVGTSRKSFIGKILESPAPEDRLEGSIASALWAVRSGATGLRTHDVGATRRAVRLWESIQHVS